MLQELGASLMRAFSSNSFFELLKNAKVSGNKDKILYYCEAVANKCQGSNSDRLPKPIVDAQRRMCWISSAFIALPSPTPGHLGSSPQNASDLFQYRGSLSEEMMLRDLLNNSSAWKALWTELLGFVGSSPSGEFP